jgi:hypothetical protein
MAKAKWQSNGSPRQERVKKRFWTFHIYEVTLLHLNWLNSLTQPHILKSRCIVEYFCMFLKLIVGAVTDKQGMVIMGEIDLQNIFVLGMEKLEYDKVMNPHRLFTIHIIVMGRNNTTFCKLLNITNTRRPNSINLLTRPTYLIAWFVTKEFLSHIFTLSHAKMNKNFLIFLKEIAFGLVSKLVLNSVDRYLPCQGVSR